MSSARINAKGQVTIPKEVRDELNLRPGDRVDFVRMHDGKYIFLAINKSITALEGIIPLRRRKPATLEEMQAAIIAGATKGYRKRPRKK